MLDDLAHPAPDRGARSSSRSSRCRASLPAASRSWSRSLEVGLWIVAAAPLRLRRAAASSSGRRAEWVESLGISYSVGFYGFSLWLTGVTVVVLAAAIGYALWVGRDRPRAYHALMLFLTGAIVATFAAQDLLLFYVSFEAMLIPLYVLVGVWGGRGGRRRRSRSSSTRWRARC